MKNKQHPSTPTAGEYVDALKKSRQFGQQVISHKVFAESPPRYFSRKIPLNDELASCLKSLRIKELFSHQGEAYSKLDGSKNIVIATPTSSGKSLVYNLPVMHHLLAEGSLSALYLFPLKALSQDQLKSLVAFYHHLPTLRTRYPEGVAAIYDGDTTPYQRRKIRQKTPPILISNPEMVHLSLLPFHESWAHFFARLKYIVIDEVHTYRGVFGSHFSWLVRRLKRVAEYYGAQPKFILSSATIGNPKEFAVSVIGEPVEVIQENGAPQSKKNFLLFNPLDSAAYTACQLLEASIKRGLRTIVYTQSRKMTELISLWTKPRLGKLNDKLSSYRAGFLPEERREIESKLSDGRLIGVISTSALELGIDIGDLDICILVGYPGSIMASLQRGGRVGRGGRESAVILIASEDALDQYYMKNPEKFFTKETECAVINPHNSKILTDHLHCAAAEIPLNLHETVFQDSRIEKAILRLAKESILLQSATENIFYASRKRPQRYVSLRGTGESLTIINSETGLILGEIDGARALKECHEGAVYLHRMKTWYVEKLDLLAREVIVRQRNVPYYTKPMVNKDTTILKISESRYVHGCRLSCGEVRVTEKVTGFQKRNNGTNKLITTSPLDLPEQVMETTGLWIEIPQEIVASLERLKMHFMGGLHALEHLLISVFPILILCDRNDIGGISCPHHEQTDGAAIFIYDGHPGGSGLSIEAFHHAEKLLSVALELIGSCECENGCPACVHSPKCGSGNRPIDKLACLSLMQHIINNTKAIPLSGITIRANTKFIVGEGDLSNNQPANMEKRTDGREFLPKHWGVFDLETQFSAQEVGGWHKIEKMRLSVGVVFDSLLDGYVTYFESDVDQLVDHLTGLDLIVGFNNKRFDNRVLSAYTDVIMENTATVDLLEEIQNHLGYRLSLNAVAEHTLGIQKTGDGLQALQWYNSGEFDLLSKYCRKDVEITRDLFLYGLKNGFFIFQNKAKKKVRLPLSLEKAVLESVKR